MGRAFHRKQIPVGSGPRTRGTGIGYLNVTLPPELTPAEIAVREEQRAQEAVQRAEADERRQKRQERINTLTRVSEQILGTWKEATDYNDQRLVSFAGWTDANICPFPVEDDDVARAFAEELEKHRRRAKYPLSLDEMDLIIERGFRAPRAVPTEQVVVEALRSVRCTAEKSCAECDDDIDIGRFVEVLTQRSARVRGFNTDVDSALDFISSQMTSLFLGTDEDDDEGEKHEE